MHGSKLVGESYRKQEIRSERYCDLVANKSRLQAPFTLTGFSLALCQVKSFCQYICAHIWPTTMLISFTALAARQMSQIIISFVEKKALGKKADLMVGEIVVQMTKLATLSKNKTMTSHCVAIVKKLQKRK